MKIAFIGGVRFSHEVLSEILEHGWDVCVVFSYLDSKKKNYSDYSNFDLLTKKFELNHVKVDNINDPKNIELLESLQPDLILVMGWSQLLKNKIISIPKFGVIGSHPTELPKFRGRAPIPWSIIKGLKNSALTFFFIEEGIDDGDILDQRFFKIDESDDASIVYDKITDLGKIMILDNLNKIKNNSFSRKKQNQNEFVENWPKRTPEDGKIDWKNSAKQIHTLIRATTHPYPGAFCFLNNNCIKIWNASIINENFTSVGKIIKINQNGVQVSTGNNSILIEKISINEQLEDFAHNVFSDNDIGKFLT